jgi:hypothetical protein
MPRDAPVMTVTRPASRPWRLPRVLSCPGVTTLPLAEVCELLLRRVTMYVTVPVRAPVPSGPGRHPLPVGLPARSAISGFWLGRSSSGLSPTSLACLQHRRCPSFWPAWLPCPRVPCARGPPPPSPSSGHHQLTTQRPCPSAGTGGLSRPSAQPARYPAAITDRQLKGDSNRLRVTPEQVSGPVDAMHNAMIWAHSSSDLQAQACGPNRRSGRLLDWVRRLPDTLDGMAGIE